MHTNTEPHSEVATEPRVAHVVAFIDAETTYSGSRPHSVTKQLGLEPGDPLPDAQFPRLPREPQVS